jgi:hypothetical protein
MEGEMRKSLLEPHHLGGNVGVSWKELQCQGWAVRAWWRMDGHTYACVLGCAYVCQGQGWDQVWEEDERACWRIRVRVGRSLFEMLRTGFARLSLSLMGGCNCAGGTKEERQ